MQFRLFSIPATGDPEGEEELNRFLRSHRAVSVQKELVQTGTAAFWCFCVEFIEGSQGPEQKGGGRRRIDYKEVLSEADFTLFAQLREVRKRLAGEEAIPVYAVCTNAQLAEMAKTRPESLADMKKIDGLGDAKVDKFGEAFLDPIRESPSQQPEQEDAAGGQPD